MFNSPETLFEYWLESVQKDNPRQVGRKITPVIKDAESLAKGDLTQNSLISYHDNGFVEEVRFEILVIWSNKNSFDDSMKKVRAGELIYKIVRMEDHIAELFNMDVDYTGEVGISGTHENAVRIFIFFNIRMNLLVVQLG